MSSSLVTPDSPLIEFFFNVMPIVTFALTITLFVTTGIRSRCVVRVVPFAAIVVIVTIIAMIFTLIGQPTDAPVTLAQALIMNVLCAAFAALFGCFLII